MSQTDTKPGFRLPWTAANADAEAPTTGVTGEASAVDAEASTADSQTVEATDQAGTEGPQTSTEEQVTPDMIDTTAGTSARRPTKFMADLSRAMQTAAEASRDETMTRFTADAKTAVEDIRAKSAEEAAALRRQADDDVAAVREWSKAEIARIREETDTRIAARKQALDGEMDDFAAVIEARVQKVNATVADYETEMAEFFERLLAEQDPTRIATMAQAMPDPPDLSTIAAAVVEVPARVEPIAEAETAEVAVAEAETAEAGETTEVAVDATPAEAESEPASAEHQAEGTAETVESTDATTTETAPAEATGSDETGYVGEGETAPEATAETTTETTEGETAPEAAAETTTEDQSAPDFAAAEAEAAAMSGGLDADDGLSMLAAARLEALAEMPMPEPDGDRQSGDRVTTRVIVRGLVSVASIATFKRSLGRVAGVSAIGVASGPDGEFVFTVSHENGLNLGEAITGLPGFDARIGADSTEGLEVSAHDPDGD